MKPPTNATTDRLPKIVLVIERWVRTHRIAVSLFTVASIAAIGLGQRRMVGHGPTPLTYAFPLAVCTYSLGLLPGMVVAFAVGVLWLVDALNNGLPQGQVNTVLALRLFSNMVIVVMAAVASAAARARDGYLDAQQQLAKRRADMVSAFSHDLRSPLAAITGYTQMVRDGVRDPETTEYLDRILVNATQLDHLISDMLAAGDSDGAAPLDVSTFPPELLFQELRREFDGTPRTQHVTLVWEIEPQTPALHTDRTKLASVVRNLVNNALKFTESGRVVVRLSHPTSETHRIEVEDTGPGIPADAVAHVFDRFYQVPGAHRAGGCGLGLFIVKRFTELLGGEVGVQSEVGRGTCFSLTVPPLAHDQPPVHA